MPSTNQPPSTTGHIAAPAPNSAAIASNPNVNTAAAALIIVRSHIGYGSPNKLDTAEAHGAPLGAEEIELTKKALGYPSLEPFYVAPEALQHWRETAKQRSGGPFISNSPWPAHRIR